MGPRLDGDVWISDARGSQLAQGTQHERVCRSHFPSLLECLLQLLENRVLQDGVHNEDQCWQDTGEETEEAIFTDDLEESGNGARLGGVDLSLLALLEREGLGGLVFTSRHACVDDPDGVGEENGGRAGERSRSHGLESGELFLPRGPLEEGTRELIPIVVDKVRDGNAKERTVQTRVQTHDALAVNDALGCIQGAGRSLFLLDLRSRGEGDERISVPWSQYCLCLCLCLCWLYSASRTTGAETNVNAMERRPPPAPARACATLSLCCSAVVCCAALSCSRVLADVDPQRYSDIDMNNTVTGSPSAT